MKDSELQLFELLAHSFYRDTMFSSRPEYDHPYFKTIVTIGKARPDDIIPWLLRHIDDDWHWCSALHFIVGEEKAPLIPEERAGQTEFIRNLWLDWGKAQGYLIA